MNGQLTTFSAFIISKELKKHFDVIRRRCHLLNLKGMSRIIEFRIEMSQKTLHNLRRQSTEHLVNLSRIWRRSFHLRITLAHLCGSLARAFAGLQVTVTTGSARRAGLTTDKYQKRTPRDYAEQDAKNGCPQASLWPNNSVSIMTETQRPYS